MQSDYQISNNFFLDVTGGTDGSVRMFEFVHPDQITQFRGAGQNDRVNKIHFNSLGNKVSLYYSPNHMYQSVYCSIGLQVSKTYFR